MDKSSNTGKQDSARQDSARQDSNRSQGANSAFENLGPDVNRQIEELRGKLDQTLDQAAEFIRARPGTSLLIAVGAGYLIGRMVRA